MVTGGRGLLLTIAALQRMLLLRGIVQVSAGYVHPDGMVVDLCAGRVLEWVGRKLFQLEFSGHLLVGCHACVMCGGQLRAPTGDSASCLWSMLLGMHPAGGRSCENTWEANCFLARML